MHCKKEVANNYNYGKMPMDIGELGEYDILKEKEELQSEAVVTQIKYLR